eukprot:2521582-Rhodomonas_salina.2
MVAARSAWRGGRGGGGERRRTRRKKRRMREDGRERRSNAPFQQRLTRNNGKQRQSVGCDCRLERGEGGGGGEPVIHTQHGAKAGAIACNLMVESRDADASVVASALKLAARYALGQYRTCRSRGIGGVGLGTAR